MNTGNINNAIEKLIEREINQREGIIKVHSYC